MTTLLLVAVYTGTSTPVTALVAGLPADVTFIATATSESPLTESLNIQALKGQSEYGPSMGKCATTGAYTTSMTMTCPISPYALPRAGTFGYTVSVFSEGGGQAFAGLTLSATTPIITLSLSSALVVGKNSASVTLTAVADSETAIRSIEIYLAGVSLSPCHSSGVGTTSATTVCTSKNLPVPGTYRFAAVVNTAGEGNKVAVAFVEF